MYLVELSDRRNCILYEKIKRANDALPYTANAQNCGAEAVIIFSPAKKLKPADAEKLPAGSTAIGGNQAAEALEILRKRGITYVNLLSDEIFAVENAALTAEGALRVLTDATEKSIFENNILISGCGRVGKAAAILFGKAGLNIALCTFDKAEFEAALLYARKTYFGRDFIADLPRFDVIVNTIPALILDGDALSKTAPGTAVIELASVPCLDTEKIKGLPLRYIPAPGLPSVCCPESAADIMLKSILRL